VMLVWVARDAKNRGVDSPAVWVLVVLFAHFIGLIVYLCARPAGILVACAHCGNKKLAAASKCPHCGNPP
jgi:Phospholipase_D-nuclease N-terminal